MNATKVQVGHATLALSQLSPDYSAAFSPNLQKWMRKHGHWYKDGGVAQTVYRITPDSRLAHDYGVGILMIGAAYAQYEGDTDFSGVRLISALCQGALAGSYCYPDADRGLEEVVGFWDAYLQVGRCAIDPEHKEHFTGVRYSMEGDIRTCLWCGVKHNRVLTPRTVFDPSWVVC